MTEEISIWMEKAGEGVYRLAGIEDAEGHGSKFPLRKDPKDGEETKGHMPFKRLDVEAAGVDEQGEPLFRVAVDGEDVSGHAFKRLDANVGDDAEGHIRRR